jgi:hypothetical protein
MSKKDVRLAKWRDILRREKLWQETIGLGLEAIVNFPALHNGVAAAFKYFELEPKNPVHNRILLGILADVCFPRPSRRTKKWDDLYYVQLAYAFEIIVREREGVGDREAAELIQFKFSGFDQLTADALRRRLPEARKRIQRLRKQMAKPTGLGSLAN